MDLSKARFNVASWGRQSGKTTWGLDKMFWKPMQSKKEFGVYWYVLQTHSAAEIAFSRYERMLFPYRNEVFKRKPHETHKMFHLLGDKFVWFKSGDNFENLRAETLDGCVIDEYRQQSPKLWPMIIQPMLGARDGWCDFLSTPNGFEHFYDLFQIAKEDKDGEWAAHYAPSTEAWWWTPQKIASVKKTTTPDEFRQEYLAEFINLFTGRAYTFGPENVSNINPFVGSGDRFHTYLPIVVGLDFNVNPMCWALGQQRNKQFYWGDEIYVRNTNTQECSKVLVEKLKALRASGHRAQPSVILCGDPAGNSRNTKATESDYAIIANALKAADIKFENRTPEAAPPVKERINTVNTHFKAADDGTNMWVHPDCKKLIFDLERVAWKEGQQVILDKSNPELTHMSDAIGYAVHTLSPLTAFGDVGKLMVIRR